MRLRNTLIVGGVMALGINSGAQGGVCQPCPPGTYSSANNTSSTCSDCGENKYCPGNGAMRENCPAGTSTNGFTRASSRQECEADKPRGVCYAGEYYTGVVCDPCPSGQYQNMSQHTETSCKVCADGMYSAVGASSCSTCSFPNAVTTNRAECCKAQGNTCIPAGTKVSANAGDKLESYCSTSNSALVASVSGTQGTGNTIGGWNYCHCRARTNNGAASSWALYGGYNSNASGCASYCASWCAASVGSWVGSSSW